MTEAYDLTDPEVRAEMNSLRQVMWPIVIHFAWGTGESLRSQLDIDAMEALQERLGLGHEFELSIGLARPDRLWLVRLHGGHVHREIPAPRVCTRLEFLELEEVIAQFEALGAQN